MARGVVRAGGVHVSFCFFHLPLGGFEFRLARMKAGVASQVRAQNPT
jgi:hypothetical protein